MNIRQLNHLLLFVCGIFAMRLGVMGSSVEEDFKTAVQAEMELLETSDISTCRDRCLSKFHSIFRLFIGDKSLPFKQKQSLCTNRCQEIHDSRSRVREEYQEARQIPEDNYDPTQGMPAYQHNCQIRCLAARESGRSIKSQRAKCRDKCERDFRQLNL